MAFPNKSLRPSTGKVYAYLFENPAVGVPRGLYWGVTLEFEPLSYAGISRTCSMTCEWIPWQARTWRDLDRRSIRCRYGDQGVEASFYFVAHDLAKEVHVSLSAREGAQFDVTMSMVVDFLGYQAGDANPEMSVSGRATVPFEGVWMRPESFDPAPSNQSDLEGLAGEFLSLQDFRMTEEGNGAVVFRPALP